METNSVGKAPFFDLVGAGELTITIQSVQSCVARNLDIG